MIEILDENNHTTYWYTTTDVAQIVGMRDDKGKIMGRNKFIAMLRQNRVLKENNMPYQYYVSLGFVQMYAVQKWHMHYVPIFSQTFIEYAKKKVGNGDWKFVKANPAFVKNEAGIDEVM